MLNPYQPPPQRSMKRISKIALAILLLAAPVLVVAQSGREVDTDSNAQLSEDDKKLNAAYEALLKEIRAHNPKDRAELVIKSLRESQRAWLKYRETQIDFVGTYTDVGSASARDAGLAQYSHDLTEARIKDFAAVPNPF